MRLTAIGTSDEVDPMRFWAGLWKSRCQPIEMLPKFVPGLEESYIPFSSDEHFSSEQVHPMQLTAIGTSDEVDPMRFWAGLWKNRCQPIRICLCFHKDLTSAVHEE